MHARPAGERLRDRLAEHRLVTAGKDELPGRSIPVGIDLYPGERFRLSLRFVDDESLASVPEKALRVFGEECARLRILEVQIAVVREERPNERRLPGLPRAEYRHDGKLA